MVAADRHSAIWSAIHLPAMGSTHCLQWDPCWLVAR
eukprot:COSAG06_NODE_12753_length_1334_cov_1.310931_2_plen_35_part_01